MPTRNPMKTATSAAASVGGSLRPSAHGDLLALYVQDHLAAAAAGLQHARNATRAEGGPGQQAELERLTLEIRRDADTLAAVGAAVGARTSSLKEVASRGAALLARLKPNGLPGRRGTLDRLLDLEGLSLAIEGKRLLWLSLDDLEDPRLAAFDLPDLVLRAEDQRESIEPLRLAALREHV